MRWSFRAAALACLAGPFLAAVAPTTTLAAHHRPRPLPAHVFAPYYFHFPDTIATTAQQSGARFVTLAFLQTASHGSCTVYWNGNPSTPVASSTYGAGIAAVRAMGGDVVPSFGGAAADSTGTELADSCTSVDAIAAEYERVITTYGVTRLDLDTEEASLSDPANLPGIDRRNKAIEEVEDWAARSHRTIQFVYTIPTNVGGLDPTGVNLLRNAIANRARIDVVNIMTFDYFDKQPHEMAADTVTAAGHLHDTLRQLYPGRSSFRLWSMIGVTEDIGVDDFGPAETFTTADATTVERWAARRGLAELSFWVLQRDTSARSHVPQTDWQFSHTFDPFTRGEGEGEG